MLKRWQLLGLLLATGWAATADTQPSYECRHRELVGFEYQQGNWKPATFDKSITMYVRPLPVPTPHEHHTYAVYSSVWGDEYPVATCHKSSDAILCAGDWNFKLWLPDLSFTLSATPTHVTKFLRDGATMVMTVGTCTQN